MTPRRRLRTFVLTAVLALGAPLVATISTDASAQQSAALPAGYRPPVEPGLDRRSTTRPPPRWPRARGPVARARSRTWGFGPEPRVKAIMGMAIGARALRDAIDVTKITVPTVLVAGSLDRNTVQAISEETYASIPSNDKRLVILPNAVHRSFDSTYCAQLHAAALSRSPGRRTAAVRPRRGCRR